MGDINWLQMHKDATTALEGDFPVVCTEATAGTSSGGKPMIKCKFKIESGQFAGRVIYNNFNVTYDNPAAMRIFFSHMKALGFADKYWATQPSYEKLAADLVQKRAIGVIGSREYQGVAREEIKGWKPAGGIGGVAVGGPVAAVPIGIPLAKPADGAPVATPVAVQQELGSQPATAPPADPFDV